MKIHLFILVCFISFFSNDLFAQKKEIIITGKVVESNSQQPIEYATVMLADPATKKIIVGVTTDLEGKFEIATSATEYYIEISFIGFISETINDITVTKGKADLGIIQLKEDSETLDEVVIRAEKSKTEFKLDKRVFNVGTDLSIWERRSHGIFGTEETSLMFD